MTSASPRSGGQPLSARYAGFICDLDGVVYRGPVAVPHAVEALAPLTGRVVFATNNASRTPSAVAEHLARLGLPAEPDTVVTSAQAGAAALRRGLDEGAVVLAVGGDGVVAALVEVGLIPERRATPGVVAVLQGIGPHVSVSDLAEASYAVAAGVRWVATNTDLTYPTDRGLAPGTGTLVAAVSTATGRSPEVTGKPFPALYDLCRGRLGVVASQVLVIGDRIDTDIAGARAAGMDSVLVLTGVSDVMTTGLAPAAARPTWVVRDLRELHEPPAGACRDGQWWRSGPAQRRISGGEWEIRSTGDDVIDDIRAGVAAVHDALDSMRIDEAEARILLSDLPRP